MDALIEQTYLAEQRHFWFRGFRNFVEPLVEHATAGTPDPRIVDAGCGTGANLVWLGRHGRPCGLELFASGVELAHRRHAAPVVQGSVTGLPFRSDSIDVVVSFDVLYCLESPAERSAIAEMFRVLRPGGSAIVNVAALEMLRGDHSIFGGEVRRYTRPELRERLEDAGFRIRRITYTNAFLFPLIAGVRAFQRLRGLKPAGTGHGDFHLPPAPINALFSAVLGLEATIVRAGIDMPIGSSLLCWATKI